MSTPPLLRTIQLGLSALGGVAPGLAADVALRLAFSPRRHPARPWELEGLTTARSLRLPGPRGHTAAHEWHPVGAAIGTVLMLHGWEGRASQFGRLGPLLAASGLRAVAVDAPGHGHSPDGDGGPAEWLATVRLAVEELGPLEGLVGHSLGSVACLSSLEHGVDTRRLVLVAPPSHIGQPMEFAANRLALTGRTRARFIDRALGRVVDEGSRLDLTSVARDHAPTSLVLHAPDDEDVPFAEGRALAAAMRDATFVETAPIGHFKILRESAVLERIGRFLTENSAPACPGGPVLEHAH